MKTNTSIVPVQARAALVVPKPTKTDIIEAMAQELISKRTEENERREAQRAVIQAKLDKEIAKFKKTRITLGDLDCRWQNAGSFVYLQGQSIPGSKTMVALHEQLKAIPSLVTHRESVIEEIKLKMKSETILSILDQPGVREGMQSAFAKLGL